MTSAQDKTVLFYTKPIFKAKKYEFFWRDRMVRRLPALTTIAEIKNSIIDFDKNQRN